MEAGANYECYILLAFLSAFLSTTKQGSGSAVLTRNVIIYWNS